MMGNKMKYFYSWVVIAGFNFGTSFAQIDGCTDVMASNFDASATRNDGSCIYTPATATPDSARELPSVLNETSGLISFDEKIWTHNDDTDTNLYAFDPTNPSTYQAFRLNNVFNKDWEELSQDKDYVYVGDFGNNSSGNRTDLKILRIPKTSLHQNAPTVETIQFSYDRQADFNPQEPNKTDFDCEAFVVGNDSIYLFSKEWTSHKTSLYALPKTIGTHIATYKSSYNVEGLVTGATYLENKRLITLCGYSQTLQPFVVLLYDFYKNDFLSANKRKILLNLPYHQAEGISTIDGLNYYVSNEKFTYSLINVPPKIHSLNLSDYLTDYLNKNTSIQSVKPDSIGLKLYPNPATDTLKIDLQDVEATKVSIYNLQSQLMGTYVVQQRSVCIPVSNFTAGMYQVVVDSPNQHFNRAKFLVN